MRPKQLVLSLIIRKQVAPLVGDFLEPFEERSTVFYYSCSPCHFTSLQPTDGIVADRVSDTSAELQSILPHRRGEQVAVSNLPNRRGEQVALKRMMLVGLVVRVMKIRLIGTIMISSIATSHHRTMGD